MALGNYWNRPQGQGLASTGTGPGMGIPNNNVAALNGGSVPQGGRAQTSPLHGLFQQFLQQQNVPRGTGAPVNAIHTAPPGPGGVGASAPPLVGGYTPPPGGYPPPPMGAAPPPGQAPGPGQAPPPGKGAKTYPFNLLPPGPSSPRDTSAISQWALDQVQQGNMTIGDAQKIINGIGGTPQGGPPLDSNYYAPTGPIQDALFNLFTQGGPNAFMTQAGQSPYLNSLAQGQVPQATQDWLQNQLDRERATSMERFGQAGAGRGSDVNAYIAREQGQTLNQFGNDIVNRALGANQLQGQYQQNALSNYLGLGGALMSPEISQNQQAFQLAFSQYLQQQGLPPDLANLLAISGIAPGATSSITTPGLDVGATAAGAVSNYLSFLANNNWGGQQAPAG
jgi:hypothetical protein